ncbi:hypothetical protein DSCA_26500 [Desulfosarcina alkanivorans]|uniref:Haem-binding uptake Tiki superfamily ChaN domain-containing protein n=1 Tax=Desulfosarcina alkanivorans TaxID=571177 RepID=A0A5K7YKL9_9BACT|nr:hypothetical protein [Desulfosarcina alkanivorans]BBO68720.1 hypothetical protein DSCA_26500 [Desulfosarcina alkanivorans]
MDSPLARVILTVLGGYVLILVFMIVYDWIKEEYPRPPTRSPSTERVRHPFHHLQAVDAVQRFSSLPRPERDAIKENLESSLIPMQQWLTDIDQSDYQIMCIGEYHEESTRQFLAEEFFATVSADVLLMEATPKELQKLLKRMNAGRPYFPLLDADIMNVFRTVRAINPDIKICGIEETDSQQKQQRGISGSREKSLARNFWDAFQPGMRHIILLGALHCRNEPNWLFDNLCAQAPYPLTERMLNAQVLGEHQDGALEAFVFFLDEIGVERQHFVIPDTSNLHPRIYVLFQLLSRQTLEKYRALIVFRKF